MTPHLVCAVAAAWSVASASAFVATAPALLQRGRLRRAAAPRPVVDERLIRNTAEMARLEVSDAEVQRLVPEFEAFLRFVDDMALGGDDADADDADAALETRPYAEAAVRADVASTDAVQAAAISANYPKSENGYLWVPRVGEEDTGAAADAAAPSADELAATAALLDIRVGKITKAWAHPDSDKLYCEEIDVGEGEPRSIASGLRPFYTAEQMEGASVLVACNLPKRKLAGFPSEGMVLCASTAAKDSVVFVQPPAGAAVGDRVAFAGVPAEEPASPAQVKSKGMWEAVAPGFKTSVAGVAQWLGKDWEVGGGKCTAPLPGARIS